ncbi:WhiB family transcriptional regulator [Streptomyces sp. 7R007]
MGNYTGSVPDTAGRRLDWMARMACRDEDPDLFFDKTKIYEARVVCVVRCPVRTQCLANVKETERGITRSDRDGIVAGLAHHERHRLDPHVRRSDDDTPLLELTGDEPCGSHDALLGHLWRGERVDPDCWSAEIRRDRLDRVTAAARRRKATSQQGKPPGGLKNAS